MLVAVALVVGLPPIAVRAEGTPLPPKQRDFLQQHCLDCHSSDAAEGEIILDAKNFDWSQPETIMLWERVHQALDTRQMPPPDSSELTETVRRKMIRQIDTALTKNTPIGGTLARRLNQSEYKASIQALLGVKDFELPAGFPIDREHHGFDNLGEGLVLSPTLLEAYADSANAAADLIFPPKQSLPDPAEAIAMPADLVISYSSGMRSDDSLRLAMKCNPIQRSCTWPSRIEASASGVYAIKVTLSSFRPKPQGEPMIAKVFARDVASPDAVAHDSLRLLQEIQVTRESPQTFDFEAELFSGQTPVLHWANAALDSDKSDREELIHFFERKQQQDPKYLAAWQSMLAASQGQGFRGGLGWQRVKAELRRVDLPRISAQDQNKLLNTIRSNPVLYAETVAFDVFENGPALEIHQVAVNGPLRAIDSPQELESQRLRTKLLGTESTPAEVIARFLKAAFRRPVDPSTVATFVRIHDQHIDDGYTADDAMHLVIRNALISPRFLYRCLSEGSLDDFDLATRLSYFLTGGPADGRLLKHAATRELSQSKTLLAEAERLLPKRHTSAMVQNFTGQWLDTRLLADIMPDPKFRITSRDQINAELEVEHFFAAMLRENRPMTDFIDPDFTWTSSRMAKNIYALNPKVKAKSSNDVQRIAMRRGGRHGGILGQAAVLMATANGVDTQPVVRGVWVLENILGTPPPPPPKAVPPITPDTAGAKTPRELLAAHTSAASCGGCHRRIDPLGLALENFDPVGRWRDNWPGIDVPIEAASTLPDGTHIHDVTDLKSWLVKNIDVFSECIAEKLMTYGTGRVPNYSERKELAAIVRANRQRENGFRDLLLALIDSQTFRTK